MEEEFESAGRWLRVLGRGSLATLGVFRQFDTTSHRDPPEEYFEQPTVTFTTTGSWGIRTSSGAAVADPGTLVMAPGGTMFQAVHDAWPLDTAVWVELRADPSNHEGAPTVGWRSDPAWRMAFESPGAPITPEIVRIGRSLFQEATRGSPGFALKIDGLTMELVAEVARGRPSAAGPRSPSLARAPKSDIRQRLAAARDYLDQHLGDDVDFQTLGRTVALSPFYLSRLFRHEFGLAPHAYLVRARLERAAELLFRTELTVTHIAQRVGWESPSHFAARFRGHYGVTPTAYRSLSRR